MTSEGHATVQSGLYNFGATSIIQSPRLTSDLPACLVYLYTQSMPSQLTVRVTDGVGGYCVLIKESNLQVDEFTEQKIDLPQANGRVNTLFWFNCISRSKGNHSPTFEEIESVAEFYSGITKKIAPHWFYKIITV